MVRDKFIHTIMQELTPHQLRLVEAVYNSGDEWISRANLARAIGKKRLTPYDIQCLKQLTQEGLIETGKRPTNAPGSDFAYIYHMHDDIAARIKQWHDLRTQDATGTTRQQIDLTTPKAKS